MVSRTSAAYVPWSRLRAVEIVDKHRADRGPLMPVLHELQEVFGYLDPEAVEVLAFELNLSKADVHGVITFYKDFRTEPAGHSVIHVAGARPASQWAPSSSPDMPANDSVATSAQLPPDGAVTLEQVFCLGNCALSPTVMVDGRLKGRVDEARFDEIVEQLKAEAR